MGTINENGEFFVDFCEMNGLLSLVGQSFHTARYTK